MEEKDSEISGPCEELRIWFCGKVPSGSVVWYCIDVSEKTESSTKKLNPFWVSYHFPSVYHAFLKGCIYSLGGQRSDQTLLNDVWILDIKSLDSFAARGEEKPKEPEKPQERLLACGEAQMAAKPYGPDAIPYCKPQEPKKPGLLLALDPDMERLKGMSLQEMAQNEGLKVIRREILKEVVKHFREHWEEEEDWKPDSGSGETWKPNYIRGPPMTFARCNPHTMVVDQTLYVLGGFEPNQTQADGWIEVFDGKKWESLPGPPHQIHSSVMISGLVKAVRTYVVPSC